jgi:hypothetical protein
MKPSMKQEVVVYVPRFGEKDEYGRPLKDAIISKARVMYTTRTIMGQDGQIHETSLEVDLPPNVPVEHGTEIEYTDYVGKTTKGQVVAMNESTNLSGSKVYFRTVYVG